MSERYHEIWRTYPAVLRLRRTSHLSPSNRQFVHGGPNSDTLHRTLRVWQLVQATEARFRLRLDGPGDAMIAQNTIACWLAWTLYLVLGPFQHRCLPRDDGFEPQTAADSAISAQPRPKCPAGRSLGAGVGNSSSSAVPTRGLPDQGGKMRTPAHSSCRPYWRAQHS